MTKQSDKLQKSTPKWDTIYAGNKDFTIVTTAIIMSVGFWNFANTKDKVNGPNSVFGGCVFGTRAIFDGRTFFMFICLWSLSPV
jgi:hypothetical protein